MRISPSNLKSLDRQALYKLFVWRIRIIILKKNSFPWSHDLLIIHWDWFAFDHYTLQRARSVSWDYYLLRSIAPFLSCRAIKLQFVGLQICTLQSAHTGWPFWMHQPTCNTMKSSSLLCCPSILLFHSNRVIYMQTDKQDIDECTWTLVVK